MTPEEFEALTAPLRAAAARAQTPAARYRHQLAMAALEGRDTPPPPPRTGPTPVRPTTEREQLIADGLIYTVRAQDRAAAEAEHRARRQRADKAVEGHERLYQRLRDQYGTDAAEAWMRGDTA
ncbi:hypothetical protein [Streptomyces sp. CC210A]|uniref:hypothetical protein n=1 Tax=Streptomyces sp. CC210A TaxID=2898184 RepID=UPI001F236D2D|nr:hypothetical protein [Streptomyces sp. CC210A]